MKIKAENQINGPNEAGGGRRWRREQAGRRKEAAKTGLPCVTVNNLLNPPHPPSLTPITHIFN